MNEMNTLTINDKTYDSFRDQQARQALEKTLPGPERACVGQHLQVAEVDEAGKVTGLTTVNPLAGSYAISSVWSFLDLPTASFDAAGYTWWKISNLTPTNEQVMTTKFVSDLGESTFIETPTEENVLFADGNFIGVMFSGGSSMGYVVCRVTGEHVVDYSGTQVPVEPPETGIYVAYLVGATPPETWVISITYDVVIKLDTKYLPESGIPAVTAADNGKIMQVKNGAWAAVALADSEVATFVDEYISSALEGDY